MRGIFVLGASLLVLSCTAAPSAITTGAPRATASPTLFVTTSAPTASPTPAAAFRYVAIGSWPARIAARLPAGTDYLNLGVSGSVASQAAREQVPAAVAARPQLVTIWLAVNDLNANLSAPDYAAALRSVVAPLVSGTTARIFVGDVPDLRSVPAYAGTDRAALLARIAAYNAAIAALAATFPGRVTVVDLFTGSGPLVSTITVSADGFHPSDAGYALIADRFALSIAGAGIVLR